MDEYTKGPWKLAPFGRGVDVISDDDCGPRIIAECKARNGSELESCEANARLIAAAPELLEAIKEATRALRDVACLGPDEAVNPEWYPIVHRCESAIAKAQPRTS